MTVPAKDFLRDYNEFPIHKTGGMVCNLEGMVNKKYDFRKFRKNKKMAQTLNLSHFPKCRRPESNRYGYHYPRDFKSVYTTRI